MAEQELQYIYEGLDHLPENWVDYDGDTQKRLFDKIGKLVELLSQVRSAAVERMDALSKLKQVDAEQTVKGAGVLSKQKKRR